MPRRRLHRLTFALAGIYNLAWGLYSSVDPGWLFRWAHMPPQRYPEIFACLAMVVGLYGLLYLEVARRPEAGLPIAAVGLLGKVLGPLGFAVLLLRGSWPWRAGILVLTNDLVWWPGFTLYLWDRLRARARGSE